MTRPENPQESASCPRYWAPGRCKAYDHVKTPRGALALCAPPDWWAAVDTHRPAAAGFYQTPPVLAVEVWPTRGPPSGRATARVCLVADNNGQRLCTAVWEGLVVRDLLAPAVWAGLSPADLAIERVAPCGRPDLILYSEVYPVEVLTNCIVASGLG